MIGQGLAKRPNRPGHPMAIGDDRIVGTFDPLAISLRDHKRRKQLHGVVCMARDLDKDLMILEQRDRDELAKQAGADCFKLLVAGF